MMSDGLGSTGSIWSRVRWDHDQALMTQQGEYICSLCNKPIPEDQVPLHLLANKGVDMASFLPGLRCADISSDSAMTDFDRLRRQESALEEAQGLLDELTAKALFLEGYSDEMVKLEASNRDLEVLSLARRDPHGDGHLIAEELQQVRQKISDLNQGKTQ